MKPWSSEISAWNEIICHITVVDYFTHLSSNVQGPLMGVSKIHISLASQYLQSTQSKLHGDPFPWEINVWHEDWPIWWRAYGDGQGKQRTVIFFWKYLNHRAMSASCRTGQIQYIFLSQVFEVVHPCFTQSIHFTLIWKKNRGKHRMLLSILKFKGPYVLGSTSSDLQDRGIPLPQACKEVRRHGFPTPLLPSSPSYCPKHKTWLVGFNEGFGRQQGRR